MNLLQKIYNSRKVLKQLLSNEWIVDDINELSFKVIVSVVSGVALPVTLLFRINIFHLINYILSIIIFLS